MALNTKRRPVVTDGASAIGQRCYRTSALNSQNIGSLQVVILRAELIGSDQCFAEGVTVRGDAPVLKLCRRLLAAGFDPDCRLHAYRGNLLALRIRSIREGAALTVDEHNGPRFAKWKPFCSSAVSPPMRLNRQVATTLAGDAP